MSDPHAPKFAYQPALPIPNGKTCLWLFLSTEIMFFAGLIGTYIVLRFGAIAWPAPHDVHLQRADRRVQHVRADLLQRDGRARASKPRSGTKRPRPRATSC